MNTFTAVISIIVCVTACAETVNLSRLTIGTNVYEHAEITKRNEVEAVVRFDGGITKVRLQDLPESIKSKWFNESKAAEESQQKAEEIKFNEDLNRKADRARRESAIRAMFVTVDGALVDKKTSDSISGRVVNVSEKGILLIGYQKISRPYVNRFQRIGAASTIGPYVPTLQEGEYALLVNYGKEVGVGEKVSSSCYKTKRIETVNGAPVRVFDCGKIPMFDADGKLVSEPSK